METQIIDYVPSHFQLYYSFGFSKYHSPYINEYFIYFSLPSESLTNHCSGFNFLPLPEMACGSLFH